MRRAFIRAVRTFAQTFLGVFLAGLLATEATLSTLANLALLDQAAAAGIVAVLSFTQNALEDHAWPVDSRRWEETDENPRS